ncbi:6-pyruvoyltetrahydropterin/6-carboxytetrahydropterin synthase [Krasilnikovia cinnamomea]|uniref:6-carboxy-5,6,7,8-tetrahydropterin synthase n=1 Tax=Krasilnikovia cinnamomea TaxID=349313 RepID=A0A4V2G701_9ACTN|nr:6-pyruvoyl tetrahydropterin synthase family protein [Krasilnikovia cinnamomea]RZU50696.1 6-pyruvoyltetrahydropterin/6-carboxytetrahydropterin synthase [Krasilnikovia cinnamomea]
MASIRQMFELATPVFFDAAHQLPDSVDLVSKKCARLHGHTYHALIRVEVIDNSRHGMTIDFKELKDAIGGRLDHRYVNEVFDDHYGANAKEATAENIALFIVELISGVLHTRQVPCTSITVALAEGYKGPDNTVYVTVRGNDGNDQV